MIKIFICQPMGGLSEEQILQVRNNILEKCKIAFNSEVQLIDSYLVEYKYNNPLWTLGESIKLMSMADAVILADGWDRARGCRIEYQCAELYDMYIYTEKDLDKCCIL